MINFTAEITTASNFLLIRVATGGQTYNLTEPMDDFGWVKQPWAVSSPNVVGGSGPWAWFSVTCFFFCRDLFQALGSETPDRPNLEQLGATKVPSWTSAKALVPCNASNTGKAEATFAAPDTFHPPSVGRKPRPCRLTVQDRGGLLRREVHRHRCHQVDCGHLQKQRRGPKRRRPTRQLDNFALDANDDCRRHFLPTEADALGRPRPQFRLLWR